jgi:hypothetical protein
MPPMKLEWEHCVYQSNSGIRNGFSTSSRPISNDVKSAHLVFPSKEAELLAEFP